MKLRTLCKSKIHRATVTRSDLHYVGSIGIDEDLLRLTHIVPGEQVSVWNLTNGQRVETYAIPQRAGSGEIVVNGAAAHHFQPGDRIIVAAFYLTDEPVEPKMIVVNERNRYLRDLTDGERLPDDLDRGGTQGSPTSPLLHRSAPST